jgi:hypothetical protein
MPRRDEYDDEERYDDDRAGPRRDDRGYDDHDQEYDDYDDRPRRGRAAALQRVSIPAIFLMVIGGVGFAFAIVRTVADVLVGGDAPNPFINPNNPNNADLKGLQDTMMVLGPILNFIWSFIVFFGGLQMKRLKNRGFVLFSCIWAMLPCHLCCILGIPFGIWALVVVNDVSVKRWF